MDKKKILLVDDEQDVVEHVGSLLKTSGFDVVCADCGSLALRLARDAKPDVIILDVFLPDIDGGEIAHRLSLNRETSSIPIIFLTGLVTKNEKDQPDRSGKHFVIAKPLLKQELFTVISQVLK